MDRQEQIRFGKFFARLAERDNPRSLDKALTGQIGVYWSYRVGDYRAICDIHDHVLTIEVIRVGTEGKFTEYNAIIPKTIIYKGA